jgi:hypothetical protein
MPTLSVLVLGTACIFLLQACQTLPPRDLDDLCSMFEQRPSWEAAAQSSRERWGVPEPILMAMLHQESRFQADAKPGWRTFLGVPIAPASSAYGYGQVKDGTWDDYRKATDNSGAKRNDFDDAVDFAGWYGDVIHRITGVSKDDAFRLYLAYHEGPSGFRRRSFDAKPWLLGVAQKVEERADRYRLQYETCGGAQASASASPAAASRSSSGRAEAGR